MGTTRRAPAETDRGAGLYTRVVEPSVSTTRRGRVGHGQTGQPGQGGARLHSRLCRVHCGLCSPRRLLNFQAPRRSWPTRDRRTAQWTVQGPPSPCPLRDPQLSMTTGLVIQAMTGTGRAQEGVLGFPDPSGGEVAPTSREGPPAFLGACPFRRDSAGSLPGPDDGDVRASTRDSAVCSREPPRAPLSGRSRSPRASFDGDGDGNGGGGDLRAASRATPRAGTLSAGPGGAIRVGTWIIRARG